MQLSFRAPDAADIMLAPVFVIKEIKTMNRLIRASTTSLMFKPPLPRPLLSSFKPDESNCLFKTIDDDFMHCCLVCPYGQETSLKNFDDNGQLLLFFHGNADDIISSHSYCKWLADRLRMCVLVCDYPGYGFSSGEPSEEKMEHAALALMDFATTKLRKKPADVYVMGKSIGSYPAVCVASHPAFKDIRGLILVSPVASAARCVFEVKYLPDFIVQRLDAVALANIKRIGVVTTYGSPLWLLWVIGWPDKKLINRGLRRLCARGCRVEWLMLTRMDQRGAPERAAFLAKVKARLSRW